MHTIPILILKLTGPMQSWGINSRWNFRDTSSEPTKSGIVGLIACAMGYKIHDKRIETEIDNKLQIGVRIDRPGIITTDFHTVMGTHTIATGKTKIHTELTYRSYIEDALFMIAVTGQLELLKKIQNALKDPKWPIYLGRKSCIPTVPVLGTITEEFTSLRQALEAIPWNKITPKDEAPKELRCVIEDKEGILIRKDAIRVNLARIYDTRRVSEYMIPTPVIKEEI